MRLADLHWSVPVGAKVELRVTRARPTAAGAPTLRDIAVGGGFVITRETSDSVHAIRSLSLPDTVGPRMRLLICGLNPSIYAAERGVPFARGGNRFWRAAVAAGLVDTERDPRAALARGIGMTDLCKRATVASSELARAEYAAGVERVERVVRWMRPPVVLFVGLEGWRAAIDAAAVPGQQPRQFGGSVAYVMPSTSGLNARTSLADLVEHMRAASRFADMGVRSGE